MTTTPPQQQDAQAEPQPPKTMQSDHWLEAWEVLIDENERLTRNLEATQRTEAHLLAAMEQLHIDHRAELETARQQNDKHVAAVLKLADEVGRTKRERDDARRRVAELEQQLGVVGG